MWIWNRSLWIRQTYKFDSQKHEGVPPSSADHACAQYWI
jgi:hypothetical protein